MTSSTTAVQSDLCPCCSGATLSACCLPMIQGKKKATTAEDLLRSRYTAFARGDVDYILETHHSRTRQDVKREEIEDWSKNSKWLGLKVVQKEAGLASDTQGTLVFCAQYFAENKKHDHWEQSFFEKENGEWRFLDAKGIQVGPYVRPEPKVGRNDACPCGSGKKFKKCCATE